MLEWIPELLGSAATGGVLGVVGNIVKSVLHGKEEARQNKQTLELAKIAADAQVKIAQTTQHAMASAQADQARYQAQAAQAQSEAAEKQVQLAAVKAEGNLNKAGDGFADSVRKLIRPFLTVYLVIFTTTLAYYVKDIETLFQYLIMQIVMLTSASVLFWFGGRPKSA